jgi:hypothetical protein
VCIGIPSSPRRVALAEWRAVRSQRQPCRSAGLGVGETGRRLVAFQGSEALKVGDSVGALVGLGVGLAVGTGVGVRVGAGVGAGVGCAVGAGEGDKVGAGDGLGVGLSVGVAVGAAVRMQLSTWQVISHSARTMPTSTPGCESQLA